jgi:organic hydroperoxide reductase OsmC/OhrA
MLDQTTDNRVNGIDLDALTETVDEITKDHSKGNVEFTVETDWTGQTRSETTVTHYTIGGKRIDRQFKIIADEPFELLGSNSAPNPQKLLMAAANACMMVGYVAQASIHGITLN